MKLNGRVEVRNVPEYAYREDVPYWVCTVFRGQFWFYGAYKSLDRAKEVMMDVVDGVMVMSETFKDD